LPNKGLRIFLFFSSWYDQQMTELLPKLLYVGDVPVEKSYHGSVLLHRLLEDYPVDRLKVVECGQQSELERRLPGVEYRFLKYRLNRLASTRFANVAAAVQADFASGFVRRVQKETVPLKPDAILSVGHGYSWIAASMLAKQIGIPFHFIVHDDFPNMVRLNQASLQRFQAKFGDVYRDATSRLCVSPYMVEAYRKRYGIGGTVLYPGRSKAVSAMNYLEPPQRETGKLRFAFAGSLNGSGFIQCINDLDKALTKQGIDAEILLYGPFSEASARGSGLSSDRLIFKGLVASEQIVRVLQTETDVLFLPISFAESSRPNMKIHFPSKLTDYSATGLPILIHGPQDSSAVRWARERSAGFSISTSIAELHFEVEKLKDHQHRKLSGRSAFDIGRQEFNHEIGCTIFRNCLDPNQAPTSVGPKQQTSSSL
jgi:hypothetical protein